MEKYEQAVLGMYNNSNGTLKKNISKIQNIKALATKQLEFDSLILDINNNELILKTGAAGKTEAKNEIRDEMITLTAEIGGSLFAYADETNNRELMAIADFEEYELEELRQADLPIKVQSVLGAVKTNAAVLEDYGIESSEIEQLEQLLEDYKAKLTDKGVGYDEQHSARKTLTRLFKEGNALLASIDKLMRRFRKKDPSFYEAYKSSRNIIDKASAKKESETEDVPLNN